MRWGPEKLEKKAHSSGGVLYIRHCFIRSVSHPKQSA